MAVSLGKRVIPWARGPDLRGHNGRAASTHHAARKAEEDTMRVEVNPNICEGHGECNAVAPEVYDLDEGGCCLIRNPEVPPDLEVLAEEGAWACPVQAITVTR
jgi:ferredoxin